MSRRIIPCLPGFSGYGMIFVSSLWGSLHWGFPLHVSFCYFAKLLADTRGDFRLWGFPLCMRCIVLPLAGITRLLDFWVRMADSYTSICQWGVTQSGDRQKKKKKYIYIRIYELERERENYYCNASSAIADSLSGVPSLSKGATEFPPASTSPAMSSEEVFGIKFVFFLFF